LVVLLLVLLAAAGVCGRLGVWQLDRAHARPQAADEQLLVPGRSLDGRTGYLVLTPLRVRTDAGSTQSAAPVLPVVRGWTAARTAPT
jgi:cytochrome oxidase assembly protein ShyY1